MKYEKHNLQLKTVCKLVEKLQTSWPFLSFRNSYLPNFEQYFTKKKRRVDASDSQYFYFNPLDPKIKIWILICCPYSFLQK